MLVKANESVRCKVQGTGKRLTSSFIADPPDPINEPVMPLGIRNLIETRLAMISLLPKLAMLVRCCCGCCGDGMGGGGREVWQKPGGRE